MKNRDNSLDFIKGIAIISVVFGHCIEAGSGQAFLENALYYDNWIYRFIYSFHMPLFAVVSGYLMYWSARRALPELMKRQLLSLIVPVLAWKTLEFPLIAAKSYLSGDFVLTRELLNFLWSLPNSFWFLWAMFWCSLAVALIEKKLKGSAWAYGAVMTACFFAPKWINLRSVAYMFPYYTVGFWLHKKDLWQRLFDNWKHPEMVIAGATAVFAALLAFYANQHFIVVSGVSLLDAADWKSQLWIDLYRWLIGFAGSFWVILCGRRVCARFSDTRAVKTIAMLGQISIGIYIPSLYINSYVMERATAAFSPNIVLWILETLIIVCLCVAIVKTVQRFKLANKLLFGGR